MHNHLESHRSVDQLTANLNNTLLGKTDVVDFVVACLLARGHLLFDDLPGLGKTTLAKALAQSMGGKLARVQCTPDLLPSDVTGFSVLNQKTREFEFRTGPVFSDVLLADEINRATPRTQSALFEAMAERQVTIDGHSHQLSQTFMVIATQNPVESHGAYPLPEAQLDRFAVKLRIGYPDRDSELTMLEANIGATDRLHPKLEPCFKGTGLYAIQEFVASIAVEGSVRGYLVDLAASTRSHPAVSLGLSPRGLLVWQRMAQAWAFMKGREFVVPDDVLDVSRPVLELRLTGEVEHIERVIEEITSSVRVPQ
jgi:MoxR-like ATPase